MSRGSCAGCSYVFIWETGEEFCEMADGRKIFRRSRQRRPDWCPMKIEENKMKVVTWKLRYKGIKGERFFEFLANVDQDRYVEEKKRDARTRIYLKDGEPVMKAVFHSFTGLYNVYDVK